MTILINLDNAATAGYRPPGVSKAVADAIENTPANPGRSGHSLSLEAARIVFECRTLLAKLFGAGSEENVFFTRNATEAINLALFGFLNGGERVLTTSFEHNSVMRPLTALKNSRGISFEAVAPGAGGRLLDMDDLAARLASKPDLAVMTLSSNVTGRKLPLADVAAECAKRGVPLLIDAAQGAGSAAIAVDSLGVDFLAFTGHKDLFGPQGTGGLFAKDPGRLRPLVFGGTGSASEFTEQPEALPDRFESGTANTPGCAGLSAGAAFVLEKGPEKIGRRKADLAAALHERLSAVGGIEFAGGFDHGDNCGIVSFTIEGLPPDRICAELDRGFGILSRPGLHCAPCAHKTLGTFPRGTLRLSVSWFNDFDHAEAAAAAVEAVAARRGDLA